MDTNWNLEKATPDFAANAEAVKEFCRRLKQIGKRVVVMGPLPMYGSNRIAGFVRSLKRDETHPAVFCSNEDFNERFGRTLQLFAEMKNDGLCSVIYPHEAFATAEGYYAIMNGIPMFKDADHLSVYGSLFAMRQMKKKLVGLLAPEKHAEEEKRPTDAK